mmetsp:Transcript_16141/g.18100  ORF Transcript_16141/g.18100 Transcript_16141/m.18100 type:complete len:367 (+) Transcript_16141:36-1136(+)
MDRKYHSKSSKTTFKKKPNDATNTESYYVVTRGRKKGIFKSWRKCQNATEDYDNPLFRKFKTGKCAAIFLSKAVRLEHRMKLGDISMELFQKEISYLSHRVREIDDFMQTSKKENPLDITVEVAEQESLAHALRSKLSIDYSEENLNLLRRRLEDESMGIDDTSASMVTEERKSVQQDRHGDRNELGDIFQAVTSSSSPNVVKEEAAEKAGENLGVSTSSSGRSGGETRNSYQMFFDGCSYGNPGKAGAGWIIYVFEGEGDYKKVLATGGKFVGSKETNNVAEYSGMVSGMEYMVNHDIVRNVNIFGDSELVIKQMRGEYRVKNARLKPLYQKAKVLQGKFKDISFTHVYRDLNEEADKLSRQYAG